MDVNQQMCEVLCSLLNAFDPNDKMLKIKSMQNKFVDEFATGVLNPDKWNVLQLGSGQSYNISAGVLTIVTGTNTTQETIIESNELFTIPLRVHFGFLISQKIANQEFYLEIVSEDELDGCAWKIAYADNSNLTYAVYQVWNGGVARVSSAPVNGIVSQNSMSIYEIMPTCDEIQFHTKVMNSINAKSYSNAMQSQIPDPNKLYKIRIRAKNLGSAPSSSTNLQFQFIRANDFSELTVDMTNTGSNTTGQGIPVNVTTMPTTPVSGSLTSAGTTTNTPATPTPHTLNSAANTNATSVKASAGTIMGMLASNISASARYLKLYNKASAPTVGTDIPVLTIPLPANTMVPVNLGVLGARFATGIAYAITANATDTDASAIGASEVKIITEYI